MRVVVRLLACVFAGSTGSHGYRMLLNRNRSHDEFHRDSHLLSVSSLHPHLNEAVFRQKPLKLLATLFFALNPVLPTTMSDIYSGRRQTVDRHGRLLKSRRFANMRVALDTTNALQTKSDAIDIIAQSPSLPQLTNIAEYEAKIEEAAQQDRIVVIKFSARWCKMCKLMNPKLHRIAERFPGVDFYDMSFDKNKALIKSLGISSLPFVQIFSGKEGKVGEFTCTRGKVSRLLETLESHGGIALPELNSSSPDLPSEWAPYVTKVEQVGSGNFGKVFSMDLTCPNSMPTKVAMKGLNRNKNHALLETEVAAIQDLSVFLQSDSLQRKHGVKEDYSAYCEPLLAEPKVHDGQMYLPMPFCNQGEFKDIYINATKRSAFGGYAGMYALLLHVAKGVKALHSAGWVHNDLHGGNAMITCSTDDVPASCYASIIDLGLASHMDNITSGARGLRYGMSPEVVGLGWKPGYPNPKSDVWQLGMLLWEVRLGRESLPTASGDVDEVIKLIPTLDFKSAPFAELEGEPEIQNLLRGMLTQNVTERWDIDSVIKALEKIALPQMRGPHESAWLNAGCLIEPIIPNGSIVELFGLQSDTALNGYSGKILQYYQEANAYEVKLNDGEVRVVPVKRLRVIE